MEKTETKALLNLQPMTRLNILINLSNHPSSKWQPEQKQKWDRIIDIPFPEVPPEASVDEVLDLAVDYYFKINSLEDSLQFELSENFELFIMLQGEFSFCYSLFELLNDRGYKIAIPTTKRVVSETQNPDGTITKTSTFNFVKWRII